MDSLPTHGLYLLYSFPLYALAWWITARTLPRTAEGAAHRFAQIDGLRFLLAFSVFVHHAFITQQSLSTGQWMAVNDHFVTFLGQGGVSLFFIITAFLFWTKAIRNGGKLSPLRFFQGRVQRLAPAFLTIIAPIVLATLTQIDLTSLSTSDLNGLLRLLSLGVFVPVPVQGFDPGQMNAHVLWTLYYEWRFYLLLPVLVLLLRFPRLHLLAPLLAGLILVWTALPTLPHTSDQPFIALFAAGIVSAHLYHAHGTRRRHLSGWLTPTLLLVTLLTHLRLPPAYYGGLNPVLFCIEFLLILNLEPAGLAGRFLSHPVTQRLGAASYSTYLAHGLVLFTTALTAQHLDLNINRPLTLMTFLAFNTVLVVSISLLLYQFIEQPLAFRSSPSPTPRSTP